MELSLSGGAFPYLEYAWVCAPNAAGQTISSANTRTILTLDTLVQKYDPNSIFSSVTIGSNQIQNVPAGTYNFSVETYLKDKTIQNEIACILGLLDATTPNFLKKQSLGGYRMLNAKITGQFTISGTKSLSATIECPVTTHVILSGGNVAATPEFTDSTAGYDQRTTVKLEKIA